MNLFRSLDAALSGELLAAQAATTSRAAESTAEPAAWTPAPEHPEIWAALAAIGNSNGVIDHTTAAQFLPASPQENP